MTTLREGGVAIIARSPLSWRGVGALLMGVLLARWVWIFFAPQAIAIPASPEHGAALEAGRLFGQAASGVNPVEGTALSNVQLVGVFAASAGKPGFAILKLDDKRQVGVAVGGAVVPGTKLLAVHPDYVLLESGGMQQRVNLIGNRSPAGGGQDDGDAGENERLKARSRPGGGNMPENIAVPGSEQSEKAGEPLGSPPASAVPKIGMPR